jgi:hypothetical protein
MPDSGECSRALFRGRSLQTLANGHPTESSLVFDRVRGMIATFGQSHSTILHWEERLAMSNG